MEALTPFVALGCIGAWITSLWVFAMSHQWLYVALDICVFPVGIIHGVMVWIGLA